jgi:DNA-binding transcriptional MerR regulator
MRVSELARQAGVSTKAVRFYESEGVLPRAARQANGYREYGEADVCRLRLVVALRGLGLELAASGRLADLCLTDRCDEMAAGLAARIADRRREVAAAIGELTHLDAELARLQASLDSGKGDPNLCIGKEVCADAAVAL